MYNIAQIISSSYSIYIPYIPLDQIQLLMLFSDLPSCSFSLHYWASNLKQSNHCPSWEKHGIVRTVQTSITSAACKRHIPLPRGKSRISSASSNVISTYVHTRAGENLLPARGYSTEHLTFLAKECPPWRFCTTWNSSGDIFWCLKLSNIQSGRLQCVVRVVLYIVYTDCVSLPQSIVIK